MVFGDNLSSTEPNNTHQYSADGSYEVTLVATNSIGTDTISQTVTIDVLDSPTGNDVENCLPTSFELNASTSIPYAEIYWFDNPINGNLLSVGANYTTDVLDVTTTFYASTSEVVSSGNVGAIEHQEITNTVVQPSSVGALVFSAYKSFVLESVDVFTNQAG